MINGPTQVALITGSTHGIGKSIALMLAKNRFSVVINGASTQNLSHGYIKKLKAIYKKNSEDFHLYIQADVSKVEDRIKIVKEIKKKFNKIDILVNNAGIPPFERIDILEASEESFERVMKVNLQGPYFLTQIIANWMIELQNKLKEQYQPYIINISSISSFTSSTTRGEYCISKAGMTMMTKLYADRLSQYNIPVFEIQPGIIKTLMTEPVKEKYDKLIERGITLIKRWGLPSDIAKAVVSIVKGNLPYATGEVIHIDGGFHIHRL